MELEKKDYPTKNTYLGASILNWTIYWAIFIIYHNILLVYLLGLELNTIMVIIVAILCSLISDNIMKYNYPHYGNEKIVPKFLKNTDRIPD